MMTRERLLEVLKARTTGKRAEMPVMGKSQLIERLKARAKAEGKVIKPMPIANERLKTLMEKARIKKQEE